MFRLSEAVLIDIRRSEPSVNQRDGLLVKRACSELRAPHASCYDEHPGHPGHSGGNMVQASVRRNRESDHAVLVSMTVPANWVFIA